MPEGVEPLQQETLRRLLAIARQLGASSDLQQILSVIIDAMRDLLDAERATVFERDRRREELFTTVAHGLASTGTGAAPAEIRFPVGAGLAGESARRRTIINVPDAHADPRFNAAIDRDTGFRTRSLLTIPLVDDADDLVGVAQVLNKRDGVFTPADEDLAAALAAHAAIAIKRGRLLEDRLMRHKLERDVEVARQIQLSGCPKHVPSFERFEVEAWNEPADRTGGDAYDIVPVPAGDGAGPPDTSGAVLLLADASGHGIGPALAVTEARSMLRMAVRLGASLTEIVLHMNRQLHADLPAGRFVTAWFGRINEGDGTLTSFSTGQGPLFHYVAADDRVLELEVDTVPLGVLEELPVSAPNSIPLAPGDLFVASSDGIFEAMSPGSEQFGVDRIIDVLNAVSARSAGEIVAALRRALADFTKDRPANDDRTLIVIKRV